MAHPREAMLVALLFGLGCDEGGFGSSSDDAGEPGSTSSAESSGPSIPDASSTDDGATSANGDSQLDCEALDTAACRQTEGCMVVETHGLDAADTCGVSELGWLGCATEGAFASNHRSTYYRELDGELRWIVTGQGCEPSTYAPAGWNECSGAPGEPEPCLCLCANGLCPWEQDALELEDCEPEQPCPEGPVQELGDPISDEGRCVLEAMRDRTPGYHQWHAGSIAFLREYRLYASESGEVQTLRHAWSDACTGWNQSTWGETESCVLRPPEFFEDCLNATSPPQECYLPEEWVTGCEPSEPACL